MTIFPTILSTFIIMFCFLAVKFPELLSDARSDGTIEEVELIDLQQKLVDLLK